MIKVVSKVMKNLVNATEMLDESDKLLDVITNLGCDANNLIVERICELKNRLKCLRCKTELIIPHPNNNVEYPDQYYCETCGATYKMIDDSGE